VAGRVPNEVGASNSPASELCAYVVPDGRQRPKLRLCESALVPGGPTGDAATLHAFIVDERLLCVLINGRYTQGPRTDALEAF